MMDTGSMRGDVVGRFVVLEELGSGAMGVVYRAYDPRLRREVALKLLRPDVLDHEFELRFVREAQSMAQLNHGNVVGIYDVAFEKAQIVIAMEYVPGQTLGEWLRERKRSWREVLEVFRAAGAGLAAAHRAGLVHRDFKPANVLISTAGSVKVADFGIATAVSGASPRDPAPHDPDGPAPRTGTAALASSSGSMTAADVIIGTPRYMAPEQHAAQSADARADQFAFCATLWEALCAATPYRAELGMEREKRRGPPPWPRHVRVPRRVVEALRRGLSPAPDERFPTMEALLEVLGTNAARARRHKLVMLAVPPVVVATGWGWTWHAERAQRCSGGREQVLETWNPARRALVKEAVLSTRLPYAARAHAAITSRLDAHAEAWASAYTTACEATAAGRQTERTLDLRMACLRRAHLDLISTVNVLARADAAVVERVDTVLAGLPDLHRCADIEALEAEVPPPRDPYTARKVDDARALLADARALEHAARVDDASARIAGAEAMLEGIDYAPARAELELRRGVVQTVAGQFADARRALGRSLELALSHGMRELSALAASKLAYLLTEKEGRPEEARILADVASTSAGEDPVLEAEARNILGTVHEALRDLDRAETEYRRAGELAEAAVGEEHPLTTAAWNNLAILLDEQGRFEEALQIQQRNLQIWTRDLGRAHPRVAAAHMNLGLSYLCQGKYREAEGQFREAVSILQEVFGPDHPEVAHAVNAVALMLMNQGHNTEAEELFRRVLDVRERTFGDSDRDVIVTRLNLVQVMIELKRYADAESEARLALSAARKAESFDAVRLARLHAGLALALELQARLDEAEAEYAAALSCVEDVPDLTTGDRGDIFAGLASVAMKRGRPRQAHAYLQRAIADYARAPASGDEAAAHARLQLAKVLDALHRPAEALAEAEAGWARLEHFPSSPDQRGDRAFTLARLLWKYGKDHLRARALAEQAIEAFEQAGELHADALREARRWLAARGG